jgi:hypothetical protein
MRRSALFTLTLLLTLPLCAQALRPCPDNGESTSTRTIRATTGTPIPLAKVPTDLRDLAAGRYQSFYFGNHPPPDADKVIVATSARRYRFGTTTFYAITVVKGSQSIFSTACHGLCTTSWWPTDWSLLADLDRPPGAVPGDEFYAITPETPKGQAVLITSDPTGDTYDLTDECLVTLTRTK